MNDTKTETSHVRLTSSIKKEVELAFAINATGGKEISPKLKNIIHLYANGDIDYETACFEINRSFKD